MILTHVEKANVVTPVIIGVLNSGDAGAGVRFNIQIANCSLVPACARSVAILLDDVAGVEVVQADLLVFPLANELGKIYGATCLSRSVPADASQRRTVGRGNLQLAT